MRLRKHQIHHRINANLQIEFAPQNITSYSGLELIKRYLRIIGLNDRVRQCFRSYCFPGDYTVVEFILVFLALWLTGGRRLCHVSFLREDPLVKRLCGLASLPSDRSLSRWLGQFTLDSLQTLVELNSQIVTEKLQDLDLPRLTLDFDGTVLSCGDRVQWAMRGYNPQNRHAKSYYPFLAHIAQTGHFLQVMNRPGNTHDSKGGALEMIQACVSQMRGALPGVALEVRLDAAFFQKDIVEYLETAGVEFAVKVPMWARGPFKETIRNRQRWNRASAQLAWFKQRVTIKSWAREVDLLFYRQKVSDKQPKTDYQLSLFSPDDGIYEYFILCSNKTLTPKHILDFFNGRCAMERQIGELKGEWGFDCIPTKQFDANSAYQNLSIFSHNLLRNFQMDMKVAPPRKKTTKRTNVFHFDSLKTLRFEWLGVAGRVLNLSQGPTLRINQNDSRKERFLQIQKQLDRMAA